MDTEFIFYSGKAVSIRPIPCPGGAQQNSTPTMRPLCGSAASAGSPSRRRTHSTRTTDEPRDMASAATEADLSLANRPTRFRRPRVHWLDVRSHGVVADSSVYGLHRWLIAGSTERPRGSDFLSGRCLGALGAAMNGRTWTRSRQRARSAAACRIPQHLTPDPPQRGFGPSMPGKAGYVDVFGFSTDRVRKPQAPATAVSLPISTEEHVNRFDQPLAPTNSGSSAANPVKQPLAGRIRRRGPRTSTYRGSRREPCVRVHSRCAPPGHSGAPRGHSGARTPRGHSTELRNNPDLPRT